VAEYLSFNDKPINQPQGESETETILMPCLHKRFECQGVQKGYFFKESIQQKCY
jgi:hypothetical protein